MTNLLFFIFRVLVAISSWEVCLKSQQIVPFRRRSQSGSNYKQKFFSFGSNDTNAKYFWPLEKKKLIKWSRLTLWRACAILWINSFKNFKNGHFKNGLFTNLKIRLGDFEGQKQLKPQKRKNSKIGSILEKCEKQDFPKIIKNWKIQIFRKTFHNLII